MKKIIIYVLMITIVSLTACQDQPEQTQEQIQIPTPLPSPAEVTEQVQEEEEELWPEDAKSSIIQEDEEFFYLFGRSRIEKIDKKTGTVNTLWTQENPEEEGPGTYAGSGILIGETIYFIAQEWSPETQTYTAFSKIGKDGTEYENLQVMKDGYTISASSMLLKDGILYIYVDEETAAYEVGADGSLTETKVKEIGTLDYYSGGKRHLFDVESMENYGYYMQEEFVYENRKASRYYYITDGTNREIFAEGRPLSLNSSSILVRDTDTGTLYVMDGKTMEKRLLAEDSGLSVVDMDEEAVYGYYSEETAEEDGSNATYTYVRIMLKTGEQTELFTQGDIRTWWGENSPDFVMPFTLHEGYMYYMGMRDYGMYLMRRSIADPSREEQVGEALWDVGISSVGTIETYYEPIHSKAYPEAVLTITDLERLSVSERFPGADKINQYLLDYQEQIILGEKYKAEEYEEYLKNQYRENPPEGEVWVRAWGYTGRVVEVFYLDENYLSFMQYGYDDWGGAHGMPYRTGFTFDLNTGERLFLADVISNSEEELKEIVTAYFAEDINAFPQGYWEDAVDTVTKYTTLESDFYLTKDGICFYFAPYYLSTYAAGFQSKVIPYEEFELKIYLKTDTKIYKNS